MPHRTLLTVVFVSAGILVLPNFSRNTQATEVETKWVTVKESFDPSLFQKVQSVDDLIGYVNENCQSDPHSLQYVNFLDSTIRRRFFHSYSHYSFDDNWIAALSGQMVWDHLSAVVVPDDILKFPQAACSQQSIVFMEACKKLGLDFRRVGFDHHYALEVKVDGSWYFFDPNQELTSAGRTSLNNLISQQELYSRYKHRFDRNTFDYVFAHPTYGPVNEKPAPNAALFHQFSSIVGSFVFWSLVLVQLVMLHIYLRNFNRLPF